MGVEIERKFLLRSEEYKKLGEGKKFIQGYLSSNKERVVRVRVKNDKGYLTIKGPNSGSSRMEFEYEIPCEEAQYMLRNLCEKSIIEKIRYNVEYEGHIWEVDCFLGENEGLEIAEIELSSEEETFSIPEWIGEEVTEDKRYYNSYIAKNPYKLWDKDKE